MLNALQNIMDHAVLNALQTLWTVRISERAAVVFRCKLVFSAFVSFDLTAHVFEKLIIAFLSYLISIIFGPAM